MARAFLTARWEDLVFLNFDCPAELLAPLVPAGTELDDWRGAHLLSLVAFRFADTRLRGVPVPGHRTFLEANLRFYVRRAAPDGSVRRAVVFIKEVVPRRAIATVARLFYNEPYTVVRMDRRGTLDAGRGGALEYTWVHGGCAHRLAATAAGPSAPLEPGSEAEFVTEHYWGYTRQRDGGTLEYRVDHPRWRVWRADGGAYECATESVLYPPALAAALAARPRSAFVADGSEVTVYVGERLPGVGFERRAV